MLSFILAAIPQSLEEIWYVYDLILFAIIALSIIILLFMRKRTALTEAEKGLKSAIRALTRTKFSKAAKVKLNLFTVKNILESATYSYQTCISEKDMYHLISKVNNIAQAQTMIDELFKKMSDEPTLDMAHEIDQIISILAQ